jgi:hypothetical protein
MVVIREGWYAVDHLRRVTVLVMALMMGLALAPAAAQDEETGALEDISQLEGIEDGVARSWSIDYESLMAEATIDAEDPFASIEGVFLLYGMVLQFDNDNHAEDAYQQLHDLDDDEWGSDFSEDAEIIREDVDDLGDRAFSLEIADSASDSEGYYRLLFSQKDEYVFVAMALSLTEDGNASADDLADYLVNDGEASNDDPEFNEDGSSTGGLWGFFPDDDDDLLGDLIPAGDEITFPVPDEEE